MAAGMNRNVVFKANPILPNHDFQAPQHSRHKRTSRTPATEP